MNRTLIFGVLAVLAIAGIWYAATLFPESEIPAEEQEETVSTGLETIDIEEGSGLEAAVGDTLVVHYTGILEDGSVFDSSLAAGAPIEFVLGGGIVIDGQEDPSTGLIEGWTEGMQGMKEGGMRRLIIPPELGYGATGFPPIIPPNATLIFEVELLEVKKN